MTVTVTVVEHSTATCRKCGVPLELTRSVAAGICCCHRGDHAPDTRVDALAVNIAGWGSMAS